MFITGALQWSFLQVSTAAAAAAATTFVCTDASAKQKYGLWVSKGMEGEEEVESGGRVGGVIHICNDLFVKSFCANTKTLFITHSFGIRAGSSAFRRSK